MQPDVRFATIVVGYDGTRAAERALVRAAGLARVFGSRLIVANVVPPPLPTPMGAFGLAPYAPYDVEAPVAADTEPLRQAHREQVLALCAEAGVEAEFAGSVGSPAAEIVELAEEHAADLIVVGTREPGLVERLLGGSVSQGVARRAHCDVLVVHPEDAEERD